MVYQFEFLNRKAAKQQRTGIRRITFLCCFVASRLFQIETLPETGLVGRTGFNRLMLAKCAEKSDGPAWRKCSTPDNRRRNNLRVILPESW